jgi:hypothetical protein
MIIRALYSIFIYGYIKDDNENSVIDEESLIYNPYACVIAGFPQIFGLIFGQIILLAMAFDRLLAVCRPTTYNKESKKV